MLSVAGKPPNRRLVRLFFLLTIPSRGLCRVTPCLRGVAGARPAPSLRPVLLGPLTPLALLSVTPYPKSEGPAPLSP